MAGIFNIIENMVKATCAKPTANGGEIYRIWFDNDPTGKCYVGQTVQGALERIKQHIADAQNGGNGGCPLLDEATRQYGINAMRYEVLESGITTHEELDAAEKFWIKKFNSRYPNGYNVKRGGQGSGTSYTPIDAAISYNNSGIVGTILDTIAGTGNKKTSTSPIVSAVVENVVDAAPIPDIAKKVISNLV